MGFCMVCGWVVVVVCWVGFCRCGCCWWNMWISVVCSLLVGWWVIVVWFFLLGWMVCWGWCCCCGCIGIVRFFVLLCLVGIGIVDGMWVVWFGWVWLDFMCEIGCGDWMGFLWLCLGIGVIDWLFCIVVFLVCCFCWNVWWFGSCGGLYWWFVCLCWYLVFCSLVIGVIVCCRCCWDCLCFGDMGLWVIVCFCLCLYFIFCSWVYGNWLCCVMCVGN